MLENKYFYLRDIRWNSSRTMQNYKRQHDSTKTIITTHKQYWQHRDNIDYIMKIMAVQRRVWYCSSKTIITTQRQSWQLRDNHGSLETFMTAQWQSWHLSYNYDSSEKIMTPQLQSGHLSYNQDNSETIMTEQRQSWLRRDSHAMSEKSIMIAKSKLRELFASKIWCKR